MDTPTTRDSPTPLRRDVLQYSGSSCQGHREGTVTHPRRAWQGTSSVDGDAASAASCCLPQEGSTRIQMLGSDPQPQQPQVMRQQPHTCTQLGERSAGDPSTNWLPQEGTCTSGGQSMLGWGAPAPGGGCHPNLGQQGTPGWAPSHSPTPPPHPSCGRGPGRPVPGTYSVPPLSRLPPPRHKHVNYRLRLPRPGRRTKGRQV